MYNQRFHELCSQLTLLRQQSDKARDVHERRSLLKEMRGILKEIDDLVARQTAWVRSPSNDRPS
ncbi:MAG TPA: hypothetical protein VLX11_08610 [Candidatus Acidoferrales bacterium]|nr:hypothetical protein [Candidatus Acidoferrales bacterium]